MLTPFEVRRGAGRLLAGGALVLALAAAGSSLAPLRATAENAPAEPTAAAPAAQGGAPGDSAAGDTVASDNRDGGGAATLTPFVGNLEIEDRLDTPDRLTIAGERVRQHLLRRFYLAHGYNLVWDRRPAAAAALSQAVLRAGEQGLDPALFHRGVLTANSAAASPAERDLLLSDAFLSYADALSRGAMPIEDRYDDEDLRPPPLDVVAALDAAMSAPDPEKAIEALAPSSAEYLAMRRAYSAYRAVGEGRGQGTGRGVGIGTGRGPHLSAADAERRARQLAVNLERMRWLPRNIPADRLVVDTAAARLQLFRDNQPVFTTRVVVGEFDKQTPEFQSTINDILFNPPWNIPRSILEKEILPKLASDRGYLAQHHMRYRGPMAVQQEAGPYSALGRLKFEMADRYDVYLHDTPEKWRFSAADRRMSHGCVRVENPRVLAALLLGRGPEAIDKAIDRNYTNRRTLPKPLPVFIVYRTVAVESDGAIVFRGDPYQRDDEIWQHLNRSQQPPIAQETTAAQRKG